MSIGISQVTRQVSTNSDKGKPPVNQCIHTLGDILRVKDFKISGSISNDKGHIPLSTLNKQIESGLAKEYSKGVTVDGVIQAIFPALHLKSYLCNRRAQELHRNERGPRISRHIFFILLSIQSK